MPLPVLLAAETADATATILAGLGAAVSAMAALLTTIVLAKFGALTKKCEELTGEVHKLELANEAQKGFAGTAYAEINALKSKAVTREYLDLLTAQQNRTLAEQTETLHEIREEVRIIDKTKASRSDLRAVSIPQRRTDGPTIDDSPIERRDPTDPPPMRPRLPSRGKYGGGA